MTFRQRKLSTERLHPLRRAISRPNARKIIARLRLDVDLMLDRCPAEACAEDVAAAQASANMLWNILGRVYK